MNTSPYKYKAEFQTGRSSGPAAEDRVVEAVIDAVLSHRLKPGERLVERELSEASGAGRMAIRNGLLRLSNAGLVEITPNSGARVAQCSQEDARQIFEARVVIEEAALQKLGADYTDGARSKLEEIVREEGAAFDLGEIEIARHWSRRFHVAVGELTENKVLSRTLTDLINTQPLIATEVNGKLSHFSGNTLHIKTIAALARGDGAEAARLNTQLLKAVEAELERDRQRYENEIGGEATSN